MERFDAMRFVYINTDSLAVAGIANLFPSEVDETGPTSGPVQLPAPKGSGQPGTPTAPPAADTEAWCLDHRPGQSATDEYRQAWADLCEPASSLIADCDLAKHPSPISYMTATGRGFRGQNWFLRGGGRVVLSYTKLHVPGPYLGCDIDAIKITYTPSGGGGPSEFT